MLEDSAKKVALVTGANKGIGLGVAGQLARLGFAVVLGSRDEAAGETAARPLLDEGLSVTAKQLDVTDEASVGALKSWVEERFGKLDVLVNNAGILYDDWQRPASADFEVVRRAFETNALGAWRMAQVFIPLLRRSGHGRIVNVSSESGSLAGMGASVPAYSVSKAALNATTRLLAAELKPEGILVNSVCPGWVATDMGGPGAPRTIEEGASSVVWAATLADEGPTGGFYRDGQPLPW